MKIVDGVVYLTAAEFKFLWNYGTDNSVVIGAHWQGKTELSVNLIARPLMGKAPIWIWDYNNKFSHLMPDNVIHSVSELKYGTQILVPFDKSPEHFEQFCAAANNLSDLHVIIDEAHNYCSAHRISPEFAILVRDKGNQNVSYTCIFQRPANVYKDIISNAAHRFVLAFDVPTDVKYLRDWLGIECELFLSPDSVNRRYFKDMQQHPKLPRYSFVYRDMHELKPVVVVGGLKLKP